MTTNETTRCGIASCPTPSPPDPRCETCGDTVLEIELLLDGDAFSMRSCTTCDRRCWRRSGHDIDFDGVRADMTTTLTRYRRRLAEHVSADELRRCGARTE